MKQEICFNVEPTGVGLHDWLSILHIFEINNLVKKVILYGSRAKGNYKKYSDIDLVILGISNLMDLQKIENQLSELNLPYIIDLSNYNTIKNPDLLDHIKRIGIVVCDKDPLY